VSSNRTRSHEIIALAAKKAKTLPIAESGLWFHQDLRDNFYYAAHLYEAVNSKGLTEFIGDKEGRDLACELFLQVLRLQDRDPSSSTYGHWPLFVEPDPADSKPSTLPVELMGCLIAFLYNKNKEVMPEPLTHEMGESLKHIYQSKLYDQGLENFSHHEAKLTSLKILIAERFQDEVLLQEGKEQAVTLLRHIRQYGMKEYGSLPWLWHWIQAFTCVWETTKREDIKLITAEMLEYLWRERALFYLKGAWAGPHSRVLPHDVPRDNYNLHDYIQFGDFAAPVSISRLEGSGLFTYQVTDSVYTLAVNHSAAREVKKSVPASYLNGIPTESLHIYTYLSEQYALGGMYEYMEEYLNEQYRWDISWPLDAVAGYGANQMFFFHPGKGYVEGDVRHPNRYSEILLHSNVVCALYVVPDGGIQSLVGCLPLGQWLFEEHLGFGEVGETFVYFQLMHPFTTLSQEDRIAVASTFTGVHSVVIEIMTKADALAIGIITLEEFKAKMSDQQAGWIEHERGIAIRSAQVHYTSTSSRKESFLLEAEVKLERISSVRRRQINNKEIDFEAYGSGL
jgi:hypothetical protein